MAVREALGAINDGEFSSQGTFHDAAKGWLLTFEGQVAHGSRSPSTLDEYRYLVRRVLLIRASELCGSEKSRR